nr:40S ribosomal protein S27-2 [Tanacetum cinerariifolium]
MSLLKTWKLNGTANGTRRRISHVLIILWFANTVEAKRESRFSSGKTSLSSSIAVAAALSKTRLSSFLI